MGRNKHIDRTGEERVMKKGQKAKIVAYRKYHDIDIEFEDGTILKNKDYNSFKKGEIANPNYNLYESRLGEERLMNNGQKAKIVAYRKYHDIDIEFEDGIIVANKSYSTFKNCEIANPNYNPNSKLKVGEERVMKNGQKAKIVCYRSTRDIDVEFEDETKVEHRSYSNFTNGTISNPNYNPNSKLKVGEEAVMNNGQKAKIVSYRDNSDIDIEFEDGTVVEHRAYYNFKKGKIANPSYNCNRLGEERIMNNGQKAKIIAYINCDNIDIEFEDGTILIHRSYDKFKKGNLANSNLKPNGKVGTFRIIKKVFTKIEEETNEVKAVLYQCKCEKCGYESLITPQMMLKHKCQ